MSESRSVVVVHSPLLGPTAVDPLVEVLNGLGWSVRAPDLRPHLRDESRPFWQAYVDGAVAEAADVVVGHSGAGAYLPLIADRLDARAVVFVDALVPQQGPAFRPSSDFLRFLDDRTDEQGLLPPWPTWWSPSQLHEMLPQDGLRRRVADDAPQVPRRIYDESVPLPADWWRRPAAYLQQSNAYDEHRGRAEGYGWSVRRIGAGHLGLATEPDETAAAVADLVLLALRPERGAAAILD